jgi:hypothetical protein
MRLGRSSAIRFVAVGSTVVALMTAATLLAISDPCDTNPCRGRVLEGVQCGLRQGSGTCVWTEISRQPLRPKRLCASYSSKCTTYSSGQCNRAVDYICEEVTYACLDGADQNCGRANSKQIILVRTQDTERDCEGNSCRRAASGTPEKIAREH